MRTICFLLLTLLSVSTASADLIVGPFINPTNGHRYSLLTGRVWDQAGFEASENEAVSLGGHLVTINDALENQWVFETFRGYIPTGVGILGIGLNDFASEGNYVWTSGDTSMYRNWDTIVTPEFGAQPDGEMDDVVGIAVGFFTPGTWHDFNTDLSDDVPSAFVYGVVESVPEPSSATLLLIGMIGFGVTKRPRIRRA